MALLLQIIVNKRNQKIRNKREWEQGRSCSKRDRGRGNRRGKEEGERGEEVTPWSCLCALYQNRYCKEDYCASDTFTKVSKRRLRWGENREKDSFEEDQGRYLKLACFGASTKSLFVSVWLKQSIIICTRRCIDVRLWREFDDIRTAPG